MIADFVNFMGMLINGIANVDFSDIHVIIQIIVTVCMGIETAALYAVMYILKNYYLIEEKPKETIIA